MGEIDINKLIDLYSETPYLSLPNYLRHDSNFYEKRIIHSYKKYGILREFIIDFYNHEKHNLNIIKLIIEYSKSERYISIFIQKNYKLLFKYIINNCKYSTLNNIINKDNKCNKLFKEYSKDKNFIIFLFKRGVYFKNHNVNMDKECFFYLIKCPHLSIKHKKLINDFLMNENDSILKVFFF